VRHLAVAFALLCASIAHARARGAQVCDGRTAARHRAGGQATEGSAVDIKANALGKRGDIRLLQAGCRTVITSLGAGIAGVDALFVVGVGHGNVLIRQWKGLLFSNADAETLR
jgi:hypothetical protein